MVEKIEKVSSIKRVIAIIIDFIFLLVIGSIVSTIITFPILLTKTNRVLEEYSIKLEGQDVEEIIHFIDVITPEMQSFHFLIIVVQFFIILLITLLYYTFFEASKRQATIGKRLVGIKVVSISDERLTKKQSLVRALNRFVSTVPLGAGFMTVFIRKDGFAFHDWITHIKVIKRKNESEINS